MMENSHCSRALWVLEECKASLALLSWESHAAVSHRIPFTPAAAMSH